MQQPPAYLYQDFLESNEARPVRILSEYLEPLKTVSGAEDSGHGRLFRFGAR